MAEKQLQLRLELPEGWEHDGEMPEDSPLTFTRGAASLQVSVQPGAAEGQGWNGDDLAEMAEEVMRQHDETASSVGRISDVCEMGVFGSAVLASERFGYTQAWLVSDAEHLVIVTLLDGGEELDETDLADVAGTIARMSLGRSTP